ncbi:uncharacterized protein CDAR_82821 [Caerostris darwini]|uniref:Uncharacterized protein n=1 Tax=Caerostris darwini TaxID=1538125 RepID=A0AAV4NU22_9ARAC|nr:uncharacterized protein CDAR_82821 [Caerostris darwini]
MFIFASILLVESYMPEHSMETQTSFDNFTCPPVSTLKPCLCTTVPDIPTIQCGKIRSLKTVQRVLRMWFRNDPIPYLKIFEARFEGLPSRAFVTLNVTRLQIKDSNMRWIAADAFSGMDSLLMLTLHNVTLFTFPPESLNQLSSLISLRLPENELFKLAHRDLRGAGKLKYLSLAGNKLTHVERGSFPIILVTLSLANNWLRDLSNSIRHLVNLEWLFLNDNRLLRLEGELDGLHNLRKLNLAKNSLRRLGRSFRDLTNVQELYLQYNSIHELGTSLHNLRQVRNLNLSMNRLVILKYSNFEGLNSLENLDLSGNRITQINGAFHSLSNLRSLDLAHNRLRNLSLIEICSLTKLSILDVSDNRLHHLRIGAVEVDSLPIERIFLARNNLTNLGRFLKPFTLLEVVDISFNKIRILKANYFTMSSRIDYISVTGNPLTCDEEQMDVYHTLENLNIEVDGEPKCNIEPRRL